MQLITWLQGIGEKDYREYREFYNALISDNEAYFGDYKSFTQAANAIDANAAITNPFYRGKSMTSANQFYFLVQYSQAELNNSIDQKLDAALMELSQMGIGGERSIGMGQFEYREDSQQPITDTKLEPLFNELTGTDAYYLLSLYYPTEEELDELDCDRLWTKPLLRKGWFESPTGYQLKRNSCWMLPEGTVLTLKGKNQPRGGLVDVCPENWCRLREPIGEPPWHHIYRSGLAFGIPFEMKGEV